MTEPAPMSEPTRDDAETRPAADRATGDVVPLRRPARRDDRQQREPEPLLRDVLGRVIRRARQQQRRTLADVAEVAGVSIPYLSEIERGRKEPSSEMLGAVCRALDLDLVDLLSNSYIELIGQRVEAPRPRVLRGRSIGRSTGHGPSDVLALAA
ncbi:helix-turn-helix domain-containing protein [Microlunatus soli]|uniref:Helix-turn-helix domain-containing protein n=1 Tax=Microlunatus soli TaxID=630515 RepID=A0A1H1W0B6_9ACTN|nr:helix-turn-helix transcriptional regulator [Microlunatus soli]SDS90452.1 Helix-turn-helix domain-containing protein [Microlunatus soli]